MGKDEQGVTRGPARYQMIPRTLTFVTCADRVLLLKGSPRKRLWAGKYNGLGGHVERGEDVYAAAQREVFEEAGLAVPDLRLRGIIAIDAGNAETGIMIFVFRGVTVEPATRASAEGALEWHHRDALPVAALVEDLPVILPRVLEEDTTPFFASYTYDEADQLVIRFAGDPLPASPDRSGGAAPD